MSTGKDKEIKELVIARLETMPSDEKVSIGSAGEFNREELISKVKKGSSVGKKIVEIEMEFLRAMKEGIIA